jgi:prepilin-type N-terminal cleavage/methylation domain-containing protein
MRKNKSRGKLNNAGMTLVEMIVSFALLGIFIVAASVMISSIMNVYYQAKGVSYGMQINGMLVDKIADMLEDAEAQTLLSDELVDDSGSAAKGNLLVSEHLIEFTDSTGSHVNIGLKEQDGKNYLAIHYYEVKTGDKVSYYAVDWMFDKAVYMGYYVKDISFAKAGDDYDSNVIEVSITTASEKYGEYTTKSYVHCYNMNVNEDDDIVYGLTEKK